MQWLLDDAARIGTVEWIYFEGGEPFLYYPVLLRGLQLARQRGFRTGVVTNGWWAVSAKDAELWLRPLKDLGIEDLSISADALHGNDTGGSPALLALETARRLGLPVERICIEAPAGVHGEPDRRKGAPVTGGTTLFKGRAADRLTAGLPNRSMADCTSCPHEELEHPERVHVDPFGNVMVCPGLSIGNAWNPPLYEIIGRYRAEAHPVCGPLAAGGPEELMHRHGIQLARECVDECHYCFEARRALRERFPDYLASPLVDGVDTKNERMADPSA